MSMDYHVTVMNTQLREFIVTLLDDDDGISECAWLSLCDMMETMFEGNGPAWWDTIRAAVDATDGRFYLPEGWAEDIKEAE